jgi:hypothetical protein
MNQPVTLTTGGLIGGLIGLIIAAWAIIRWCMGYTDKRIKEHTDEIKANRLEIVKHGKMLARTCGKVEVLLNKINGGSVVIPEEEEEEEEEEPDG